MTGYTRTILFAALLAIALGAFPHAYRGFESSNELSRLYLAVSIVHHKSLSITRVVMEWGDITDKSQRNDKFYSDKAPGSSWLAVFPALILKGASIVTGLSFTRDQSLTFARILAVTFPCFLFLFYLPGKLSFFLKKTEGQTFLSANTAVVVAYSLGTPVWVYSTLFYSHQLAAAALFTAYILLRPEPGREQSLAAQLCAGFLLGFAIALDYPAIWGALCITVYAIRKGGPTRRAWFWMGLLLPIALLCAYNWAAFGGPFYTGYSFKAYARDAAVHAHGILGIGRPTAAALTGILLSPKRGLFFFAPWLLFAIPGFIRMARMKELRADFALCLAVVLGHTLLIGSFGDWPAGWSYGPRHLMPMLPFLLPALVIEIDSAPRHIRLVISCLVAISIAVTALAVLTFPHVPTLLNNPVTDLFIALVKSGDVGPIIGGFDNRAALAVAVFIVAAGTLWFCIGTGKKHGLGWSLGCFAVASIAALVWCYSLSKIPPQENSQKRFAMGQVYSAFANHENACRELQPLTLSSQPIDMRLYATYMLWKMAEDKNDETGATRWRKEYEYLTSQKGGPPTPAP